MRFFHDDIKGRTIRYPEIDRAIGPVCEVHQVRDAMVRLQREIGRKGPVVAEGRDVGTIVFPDADVKFYMVASIEKRAQRRQEDLQKRGIDVAFDQLKEDIARRDKRDSQRKNSPLMKADDAILVDTTHLSVPEQVDFVVDHVSRKINL